MTVADRAIRSACGVAIAVLAAVVAGCAPPAATPSPASAPAPPPTQASQATTTSRAAADEDVFVTDGGAFSVGTTGRRPQQFKITAQTDYALMSHITWNSWGGSTATGHGTYTAGLGSPSGDAPTTYPNATITLSQIRPDSNDMPEYTHVHISAPGMDTPEDDVTNKAVSAG